ncbi:PH domain-containing protein [Sphingomonas sp. SUN019]|uniref:photosynthetic complex putative assembly protein PuhB n=1 Tax=Sphingomonas sp. SUN019 TaxID=2937788 RepID=UPI002164554C|nr:photosynthetic complex putative assembly protein PuhB [Sphingomonas sp. SUN019]UVO50828.1 PH domain-containing protein [Sphingomonas sp. SUN019]
MTPTEYEVEPIPGLPGHLPPGERILWQGSPDRRTLARTAFHTRLVAAYFLALAIVSAVSGSMFGLLMTATLGTLSVILLNLLAWWSARSTIYTLTDRRIVLRIGMALPTCINLPLMQVGAAGLHLHTNGVGDVALALATRQPLGYATLWPHARPWKLARPEPMLRSIDDATRVGALIARTCLSVNPTGALTPATTPDAHYPEAVAA